MFEEVPNRRITQRRRSLKDALVAGVSLFAGAAEAVHKGRIDWTTVLWAIVFILSIFGYWNGRHEDPWNPPEEDVKKIQSDPRPGEL